MPASFFQSDTAIYFARLNDKLVTGVSMVVTAGVRRTGQTRNKIILILESISTPISHLRFDFPWLYSCRCLNLHINAWIKKSLFTDRFSITNYILVVCPTCKRLMLPSPIYHQLHFKNYNQLQTIRICFQKKTNQYQSYLPLAAYLCVNGIIEKLSSTSKYNEKSLFVTACNSLKIVVSHSFLI